MVAELNRRPRADRILAGEVDPRSAVALADGTEASEGDLVITRRNRRSLITLWGRFVRNGDRWQVFRVHRDGSLEARRVLPARRGTGSSSRLGSTAVLPARYTVDTAHVLLTAKIVRENPYVALTRGRQANHAYVATDLPDATTPHPPRTRQRAA